MGFFANLKKNSNEQESAYYREGMRKSRDTFGMKIKRLATGFDGVNEDFLEELMVILLEADIGIEGSEYIINEVRSKAEKQKVNSMEELNDILLEVMERIYRRGKDIPMRFNTNGPTVIMLVGVNGSGKTTTCAKLANSYRERGRSVMVVAADTFRAGATDQLQEWANRLSIPCVYGKPQADPSSVIVDGCRYAKEHDIQVVLIDTAGRLQNKVNLMNELAKMHKVIDKEIKGQPTGCWLVIDGTTGQNGIMQAKEFMDVTNVNGIILTKLDGSAKGGIVLAIRGQLGLPVKYVGLGEKAEDLRKFDIDAYLMGLCEGISDA